DHAGLFVEASGGTLFLDEIGDTSPGLQAKLLRALQEGEVRPVGAAAPRRVDVRVIAATNRDLDAMRRAGTFRDDLYFRLGALTRLAADLDARERAFYRAALVAAGGNKAKLAASLAVSRFALLRTLKRLGID